MAGESARLEQEKLLVQIDAEKMAQKARDEASADVAHLNLMPYQRFMKKQSFG
jgi:CTP:molybdopterin cytidylyltransferase MocA